MQSAIDLNSNFGAKKRCNQINFLIPNLVERKAHKLIASLGSGSIKKWRIFAKISNKLVYQDSKHGLALGVGSGDLKYIEMKQR